MRTYLFVLLISASLVACKNKQHAADTTAASVSTTKGETVGKVSGQYISGGCSAVIVVKQDGADDLVLIPKDPLPKAFNKDGIEIRFNYTTLRMPQPKGCTTGIPAEIRDVSAK